MFVTVNFQAEVSIFSDHDPERFSVSEDGTQVIGSANKEDSGDYIGKAFSKEGVAFARTTLEFKGETREHHSVQVMNHSDQQCVQFPLKRNVRLGRTLDS